MAYSKKVFAILAIGFSMAAVAGEADSATPGADPSAQPARAGGENGVHVIEAPPMLGRMLHATVAPDGDIEVTHAPAVAPSHHDD